MIYLVFFIEFSIIIIITVVGLMIDLLLRLRDYKKSLKSKLYKINERYVKEKNKGNISSKKRDIQECLSELENPKGLWIGIITVVYFIIFGIILPFSKVSSSTEVIINISKEKYLWIFIVGTFIYIGYLYKTFKFMKKIDV